jgi:membrane-bound lytic murein transglycosylase D
MLAALGAGLLLSQFVVGCKLPPEELPPPRKPAQASAPAIPAGAQSANQKTPIPPTPQAAIDQKLIDQVETAYASGAANYRAGKLKEAKASFDHAVDLMLTSGLDLKNDPQMSEEFEHILDAVNTLEMAALKQGNGFGPKIEPSPVDIANDVTFPVDPALLATAQAEIKTTQSDLPLVINDYVASQIGFFSTRGRGTLLRSLQRAGRYKTMIQKILSDEGVPQDLIYQAVAESGFQPQAFNSRSGAGGMWQFMPFAGYGLTRNGYVDERFDPEKSTRAYARYIKVLYNQLGDWYLAMAAYDWGPGNIQRAVQRTGYADFWELYRRNVLPQETKNYVPIILAATIIAKNPKQYGIDAMAPDPPILTDTVTTQYAIDLHLASDIVEAPLQILVDLNPSLLRLTTPADQPFDLHLPAGTGALFAKRVAEIPEDKRRYWRYHKLVPGETLADIAHTFRVSQTELAYVNQIQAGDDLASVEALVIPVAPVSSAASIRNSIYVVRRGDTLITIADRFGVSVAQLRRWNHLADARPAAGRRLNVAEPAHISQIGRTRGNSRGSRRISAAVAGKSPHKTSATTSTKRAAKTASRKKQR